MWDEEERTIFSSDFDHSSPLLWKIEWQAGVCRQNSAHKISFFQNILVHGSDISCAIKLVMKEIRM